MRLTYTLVREYTIHTVFSSISSSEGQIISKLVWNTHHKMDNTYTLSKQKSLHKHLHSCQRTCYILLCLQVQCHVQQRDPLWTLHDTCQTYCIPQEMRLSRYESSSCWKRGREGSFPFSIQLPFIPISAVLLCNSKSLSFEMAYIQTCIEKIPGSDWWFGKFMRQPEMEDRRCLLRNNYLSSLSNLKALECTIVLYNHLSGCREARHPVQVSWCCSRP